MKVAIVSGASRDKDVVRGIGVHTSELFKALRMGSNKNIDIPEISPNDDLSKFDVVHFTSFRPFFISLPFTKPKNTKFVLTVHDLIPLIYPDVYKPGIKGTINYLINKFLVKKYVDAIITISETSKKDVVRFLQVKPEVVHVIYLGPKEEYKKIEGNGWQEEIKSKFNLPDKFILYYGDINYNKNIPTLVKACIKLKIPLVLAGKQALEVENMDLNHPENIHLKPILSNLLDSRKVIRTGYMTDEDANKLLNLATCLVQPSYYEGFGLSVIHAFASGCPAVAAKAQALVEIGGEACLYFDPKSEDELINTINKLIKNKETSDELIRGGFVRVKKFSWKKCADETLDVYEKV